MRFTFAALVLSVAGCWNGADASHLPCTNDEHCGRGQSCVDRFCDGPPVDTAAGSDSSSGASASTGVSSSASGSDTGEACDPPMPTTCEQTMRPATRTLVGREFVDPMLGRGIAAVAGDFLGDPSIDVAVLSRDNYFVVVLENAGTSWEVSQASYTETTLTELNDMLTADLNGDDRLEFLLLSFEGQVEVLTWNNPGFSPVDILEFPALDLVSFTAADLLGDAGPELVVSGSSSVYLVPNEEGNLIDASTSELAGTYFQPWDTLVVGAGEDLRVLVPEANNASTAGVAKQDVHALRLVDGALVAGSLGTDFRNPWAIAQGDFLGDDRLEIAVAERRLDGTPDMNGNGTSTPGQLRFFRMDGGAFEEVGEPLEVGVGPTALAAADLDCDGKTDLVLGNTGTAGQDDGRAQVLFGSCEPSARAADLLTLEGIGDSGLTAGSRLAVGDFDGNGLLEVAIPDIGDLSLGDADVGERVVFVGVQGAP